MDETLETGTPAMDEQAPDHGLTPEELASMTEEERKAFEDDGEDAAEDQKAEEVAGDEPSASEAEGAQEEEQEAVTETKPPASQAPFVPVLQAVKTDDIQARLDELDKKLEEGDIDIIQYTKQRDPLIQQRIEADLTAKFNRQSAEQLWLHEQNLFFRGNPEFREDPILNGALQSIFKTLDTRENAHKTGYELLIEAKEAVEARIAALSGGKASPGSKEDGEKETPPRDTKPALEKVPIPKTLAGVAPAEQNEVGRDEFAHLDSLEGLDFEKALAKLTPDQQARYLRG